MADLPRIVINGAVLTDAQASSVLDATGAALERVRAAGYSWENDYRTALEGVSDLLASTPKREPLNVVAIEDGGSFDYDSETKRMVPVSAEEVRRREQAHRSCPAWADGQHWFQAHLALDPASEEELSRRTRIVAKVCACGARIERTK